MWKYLSKTVTLCGHVVKYACFAHCTFEYLGDFVLCSGPSMEPTLYSDDILITERISPRLHNIKRGDVIIAISPTNPETNICKRIIGLPGDRILSTKPLGDIKQSAINLTMMEGVTHETAELTKVRSELETEAKENKQKIKEFVVPRGHVWIEGDNRMNSADSRYYGPIPQGLVKSRVVARIYPLSNFKYFLARSNQ